MRTKLDSVLAQIIDESWNNDSKLDINQTASKKRCLILSNKESGKVALLGTMKDELGKEVIEAVMVDIHQWQWAEDEGFTRDEIVDNDDLCRRIFKRVPVRDLPNLLA